jgi:hypothetical protein
MNLSKNVQQRLFPLLEKESYHVRDAFQQSKEASFRKKLDLLVIELIKQYNLKIRLGSPIYHQELRVK